jgi:5-methylcytosine-specific restriction endonuclease McrA
MLLPKVGDKLGKLVILSFSEYKKEGTKRKYKYAKCLCDCGNTTEVRYDHIKNINHTKSCGCLYAILGKERRKLDEVTGFNNWYTAFVRNANNRGYKNTLEKEYVYYLTQLECHYCGKLPNIKYKVREKYEYDFVFNGLDRVDNTVGYLKENVVTCCKECNVAKHTQTQDEFFRMIKNIYEKHGLRKIWK